MSPGRFEIPCSSAGGDQVLSPLPRSPSGSSGSCSGTLAFGLVYLLSMLNVVSKKSTAAVLLSLTLACAAPTPPARLTEIELDVFSGRPNPRWTVTQDLLDVWQRVEASPSTQNLDEPNHLGYRGFVLKREMTEARIYNGWIWVRDPGGTRTLRDSSQLETALIDEARARGFADLIK